MGLPGGFILADSVQGREFTLLVTRDERPYPPGRAIGLLLHRLSFGRVSVGILTLRAQGDGVPSKTIRDRGGAAVFYVAAVIVGAVTGALGTTLRLGLSHLLQWPEWLRQKLPIEGLLYLLAAGAIAACMVVISVWLVRTFAPEAGGSGVQEIEGAMEGRRKVRWQRVLPVKFFGGFLSLGSGLVIGREGPTIHIGACIAQAFSDLLRLSDRDGRGLLAAGGAAGLAAAFSAPLGAILFVIEETRRQFPYSLKSYTALMLASVTSGVVTVAIVGIRPFMALTVPDVPLPWLPAFVVLGFLLGLLGVAFNRALIWSLDFSLTTGRRLSFYVLPMAIGFAVGVLLVARPEATMGGENLAVRLIGENLPLVIIAVIVVVRFIMTMASYSTGVPGGIFAPILSLATAAGLLYGDLLSAALPMPAGMRGAFAVAAMGGLFSSTVRAPLVGIVLTVELTGAYSELLPTILTCLFANLIADWFGGHPIYDMLLERTLALANEKPHGAVEQAPDGSPSIGGWDQR
jgi:chloride channel protein, CIC family